MATIFRRITSVPKVGLTPKLTLIFVLFAAILLASVGALAYLNGRSSLEAATENELISIAGEKQNGLDDLIQDARGDIRAMASSPYLLQQLGILMQGQADAISARKTLATELYSHVGREQSYTNFFLLAPDTGKVILATDPGEVGQLRADRTYFQEGKSDTYVTAIYLSPYLQRPGITIATPVFAGDGHLLVVLAGRLNMIKVNAIIENSSDVWETDDAFLVNTAHQFVTPPHFLPDSSVLNTGIHIQPVELCLQHKSGTIFARDYRGVPVIAVYRWMPERQMCLIQKVDQDEALALERSFASNLGLAGLAGLFVASLVAVGLSHTIIRRVRRMQLAAQRYGQGELDVRLLEDGQDELGDLAHEFNAMAASLEQKENQLRGYSLELEHRVAERTAQLQESQMRFQALIEHAPDGIALLGRDGKLQQVTPSTLQILGYSPDEAAGQDPGSLTHPDDLPALLGLLSDLLEHPGKVVRTEYRFLHKDGSWRWLESTISNLMNEPGIEALVFNYRDITEQKRAGEALQESEEKFKYIFDHSLMGKTITQLDERVSVNQAFCDMLGYSEEELRAKKWQELTHPDDVESSTQVIRTLLSGERESVRFTKRYLHKDGSVIWADVSISLRRDPEGQPLYFMASLMDMTERKWAEIQLADALEFNQRILTSSPIGILTYKFNGDCISANAQAAQLLGGRVEELQSQNFHQLQSWRKSGLYDLAQKAIAEHGHVAADVHHITTFGKDLWLRAEFVTFKSRGEELLLLTVSDITDRVRGEETLRRFELLSENSRDMILFVRREDGQILDANKATLSAYGYRRDELLKLTFQDLRADNDPALTMAQIAQSDEGGALFVTTHRRKDGSTFPVEVSAQGATIGGVRTLVSILRDITDRRKAETALREKERLLSEAQRIGQIGSLSYDIGVGTFQFSDEIYVLLDVAPETFEHRRQDFLTIIYPSDRSLALRWIEEMVAGRQVKELNFRIFRRNGELRYLRCHGAVEFNSEGKPKRFIGTLQDVTERRLAEIQIDQQIKHLTSLTEIDRAILSGADRTHILNVILSEALSQLQADAAGILLVDGDNQTLHYVAAHGFMTGDLAEMAQVRVGQDYAGRVVKERRLIQIADLNEKPSQSPLTRLVAGEKFVSYVGVPLILKREVKGVLELFHRAPFQPYQEWLDFLNTLAGQTTVALENAALLSDLQASNREITQAYDATIEGWSHAMDLRDKETEGHSRRVTELTLKVARAMGIPETQLVHIRRGALLHDIGKLGIPDQILFKPAELTPEEREIMQRHPEHAYEMLSPISYLKPALPIPYFHHERWDGSGYPLGLRGDQIPLEARIFAVVDVWDALLSDRPYRKAWTVERTLEFIQSLAGSHFDPQVVDCFMKIVHSQA